MTLPKFKLVPLQANEEMKEAGLAECPFAVKRMYDKPHEEGGPKYSGQLTTFDTSALADIFAAMAAAAPDQPLVLYEFLYNSCIYESADGTVSLHLTKAGAYKAMVKYQWDMWIKDARCNNKTGYAHEKGWNPRKHATFKVRPIEVNP